MAYEWVKAFHIIAVIAWMAGMLYLPRLFVYHCAAEAGSVQSETFKVMERRLLRAIINPAMVATWVLIFAAFVYHPEWIQAWLRFIPIRSSMSRTKYPSRGARGSK